MWLYSTKGIYVHKHILQQTLYLHIEQNAHPSDQPHACTQLSEPVDQGVCSVTSMVAYTFKASQPRVRASGSCACEKMQ